MNLNLKKLTNHQQENSVSEYGNIWKQTFVILYSFSLYCCSEILIIAVLLLIFFILLSFLGYRSQPAIHQPAASASNSADPTQKGGSCGGWAEILIVTILFKIYFGLVSLHYSLFTIHYCYYEIILSTCNY